MSTRLKRLIVILLCITGIFFFLVELTNYYTRELPSIIEIVEYKPKTISRIYDRNDSLLGSFYNEKRDFISIQKIPELVRFAFISAEDKNFYKHSGYDLFGLFKAIIDFSMGQKLRGASTITQQVTKGLLLSGERSLERKFKELILATQLEKALTKDEILEIYLNEVYLGEKAYGVSAAADTYFSKELSELLPREAAFLAALPKSPEAYNPKNNRENAIKRRNFVLTEMVENGYLEPLELNIEKGAKLETIQTGELSRKSGIQLFEGFLAEDIKLEVTKRLGARFFRQGGLSIKSTIDTDLQNRAKNALNLEIENLAKTRSFFWLPFRDVKANSKITDLEGAQTFKDMRGGTSEFWQDIAVVIKKEGSDIWISTNQSTKIVKLNFFENIKPNLKVGNVIKVQEIKDTLNISSNWYYNPESFLDGGIVISDLETGEVLALEGGNKYKLDSLNHITEVKKNRFEFLKPILIVASLRKFVSDEMNIKGELIVENNIEFEKTLQKVLLSPTYSQKLNKLLGIINKQINPNEPLSMDWFDDTILDFLLSVNAVEKNLSFPNTVNIQSDLTLLSVLSAYAGLFKDEINKDPITLLLEIAKDEKKILPPTLKNKLCNSCVSSESQASLNTNTKSDVLYQRTTKNQIILEMVKWELFDFGLEIVKSKDTVFFINNQFNEDLVFESVIGIVADKLFGCHIEQRQSNVYPQINMLPGRCLPLIHRITDTNMD